ncbi:MAG: phage major capsid protein [Planctomycetota bacterium]
MPNVKENESEKDFVERCIPVVLGDKTAEDGTQAAAICHSMYRKHMEGKSLNDTLIAFGGAVKALDSGKLGGYLVTFTKAGDYDLTAERFDAETDFGEAVRLPVLYNHGLDSKLKRRRIGTGDLKHDDAGLWFEAQLNLRDEYEKKIYELARTGKMSWSSGSALHAIERVPEAKGTRVTQWFIAEASLTPTPAEPRTQVVALKSLIALPRGGAEGMANPAPRAQSAANSQQVVQGVNEMDEKEIKALVDAQTKAITDANAAQAKLIEEQGKQVKSLTDSLATQTAALEKVTKALEAEAPRGSGVKVVTGPEDVSYKAIHPRAPFGKFLLDVRDNAMRGTMTPQLKAILGSSESIPSEGGFLVATDQVPAVEKKMFDSGVLASRCSLRQISAGANSVDLYGRDEDSRAAGSRYGGVTGYRVAEAVTITASGAIKFYKYTLKPKEYAAVYYATNDVLQDTALLESEIMDAVPAELAFMLDDDIMNGLGVAGCLGFGNSAAVIAVAKETGQKAATFVYENAIAMWARMFAGSFGSSVWLVNQNVLPQLPRMSLAVGTGGSAVYLPPGGASASPFATLLGRPVVVSEMCASLGTQGDVYLVDLGQYQLATKGGLQSATSIHVQFLTNQNCYRFIMRYDGQPKWKNPLTPYKGTSDTVSPFIALAVRA